MQKRDIGIGAVILALFGTWGILAAKTPSSGASAPVTIQVASQVALGPHPLFRGNPNSPITLVEFGDYECASCARMHAKVQELLSEHPGQVRLVFRQFPLPFHAQAQPAALLAEDARRAGKFWAMHDALYGFEGDIDPTRLNGLRQEFKLSETSKSNLARAVRQDQQDATHLHVEATPSFYVVTQGGRVWSLGELSQVNQFLNQSS